MTKKVPIFADDLAQDPHGSSKNRRSRSKSEIGGTQPLRHRETIDISRTAQFVTHQEI